MLLLEVRVKVTRNYQVTIPLEVRERLGIRVGDVVRFVVDDVSGRVYLEKVSGERKRIRLGKALSPEDIERLIERGILRCLK